MTTTNTHSDTRTNADTDIDEDIDQIVFTEIVVSNPTPSGGHHPHRKLAHVGTYALIAGGAVALLASASPALRATSEPAPTPVPAAISPSAAGLGYLLSDSFPDISIAPPTPIPTPSPADLTLGYLLSDEFPDLTHGRDRSQDPLAFLFSADVPDVDA